MTRESSQINPQEAGNESQEKPKKFLFIDDSTDVLSGISALFDGNNDVGTTECHSLKDAREAIESARPEIIFLDHNFGENGGEGLEIAKEVRSKYPATKIYSTTTNSDVSAEYERLGISHMDKHDIAGFLSIISPDSN
jgi:DNA-binding NtrC family response regulator